MNLQDGIKHITDHLYEGAYIVDCDRRIVYWNTAAEAITGFQAAEVIGKSCSDNILVHVDEAGHSLCHGLCPLAAALNEVEVREATVYLHHKLGHRVPVRVRILPLTDDDGTVTGGLELFTEQTTKTEYQKRIQELQDLVLLDTLTQLPNRRYLESEIEAAFSRLRRNSIAFGVLFFDLDHFKTLNDTYGHTIGDQALKIVAQTLINAIRPQDTVGRWGGEEFLGVFPGVHEEKLKEIGERLRVLVEKSHISGDGKHAGQSIELTVSAGGALAETTDTMVSIVEKADAMMYQCKNSGRNCVNIYNLDTDVK